MSPFHGLAALAVATLLVPHAARAEQPSAGSADTPEPPGETPEEADADDGVILVQATRSGRRVQDEAVKVEVIGREEIEEKILMRPGNIAVVLSETGGLRVQVTSPALGASNIRVQGMDGRFTQLLADGLPLYGGQASSLGLLQIPPTDLGQVEVIKGTASALYGPSALGGVINLVSRRPRHAPEAELLLNATSRAGQDATAYLATPLGGDWSASLTGGFHRQSIQELDNDGWADMPGFTRWTVRPRLFWEGAEGTSLFATFGAMTERRTGGTLPGRTAPDGTPFPEGQETDRFDGGLVAKLPVAGVGTAHVRASGMRQDHVHRYGADIEIDRHGTLFAEASLAGKAGDLAWVGGIAWQEDSFASRAFPAFDYDDRIPGLFAQLEQDVLAGLTLSGSARVDFHNRVGTRFSPRLSMLYRDGPWTLRASAGQGFHAPTPFVDEIEAAGLSRLEPLGDLDAEVARTASVDLGYAQGPFEATFTLFGSNSTGLARLVDVAPDRVRLSNIPGEAHIRGAELLMRYRLGDVVATGSYMFVDAREPDPNGPGHRLTPLTPRHTAGLVTMWEARDKGRVGLEVYYTGRQSLDDNPYRSVSRPYVDVGLLAELVVGPARLFLNAENILGTRLGRYDPVLLPQRAPSGVWTVDAWAPLEGFVFNGGVRLRLGGGR